MRDRLGIRMDNGNAEVGDRIMFGGRLLDVVTVDGPNFTAVGWFSTKIREPHVSEPTDR